VLRDGRDVATTVKLAERPSRTAAAAAGGTPHSANGEHPAENSPLGLTVRDLDAAAFNRYGLPSSLRGVLITRVEPLSGAADAEIHRGTVLMELNRTPLHSAAEYRRLAVAAKPGEVMALYLYDPSTNQRQLKTVRIDER
jgi:serine protease Do